MARLVTIRRGSKSKKTTDLSPFYSLSRDTTKSILVSRKLGGIGDVIMTLPAIRGLREKFPKAKITYAVCNKWGNHPDVLLQLVKGNPYLNAIVGVTPTAYPELGKLQEQHDYYIDITGQELMQEYKGKSCHRTDLFCDRLHVAPRSKIPELFLNSDESRFGEEFIKNNCDGNKPIAFQPNCYGGTRNWGVDRFRDLASRIVNELKRPIIVFSDVENARIDIKGVINRINNPIRLDASILKHCAMMIGADSGLLHVAGAVRTPILGLFGSVPPMSRLGYYVNASWIWHSEMPCIGCYYKHNCPPHTGPLTPCMSKISVDEVLNNVKTKLARVSDIRTNIPTYTISDIRVPVGSKRKILIGVLTFDLLEQTKWLFETIDELKTGHDISLFVADNFSTDRTFEWLVERGIKFVRKECSVAGGINICMQEAVAGGYDYLLMCNNDVKLSPNYVDVLVSEYESHKNCGLITGVTLDVGDRNDIRGKLQGLVNKKITEPMGDLFYTGEFSAFLMSTKHITQVGFFDEEFSPRYLEDDDYKRRIELAGLNGYRTGKTTFIHWCAATVNKVVPSKDIKWTHNYERNVLKYNEKWGGSPKTIVEHPAGRTIASKGYVPNGGVWAVPYNNPSDPRIFKTVFANNGYPRRVLILQHEQMGDVVLSLPVAKEIKRMYPNTHITWGVHPRFRSLFEAIPYVDALIDCNTPDDMFKLISLYKFGDTYDRIYVCNIAAFMYKLYESTNIDFVSFTQRLGGMGTSLVLRTPVFVVPETLCSYVDDLLAPLKDKNIIALSFHSYSQLPKIDYYVMDRELKMLHREFPNVAYIYLGKSNEEYRGKFRPILKINNDNLAAIPEILRRCKLLISVNSANLWIGSGVGVPLFDISASSALCDVHKTNPIYLEKHLLRAVKLNNVTKYKDIYDHELREGMICDFARSVM